MRALTFVLFRCLLTAAWALPLALLILFTGCRWFLPEAVADQTDRAFAAPWLHLPLFLLAATLGMTAVEAWPTFARDRPGAIWLARFRPGPLHGCGAAAAAALLLLLVCLAGFGLVLPQALPDLPAPLAHHRLTALDGGIVLTPSSPALTFATRCPSCTELQLRPAAVMPGAASPVPTRLRVLVNGTPLPDEVEISGSHQLVRVPLQGRPVQSVALTLLGGNLALVFGDGALLAVAPAPAGRGTNAALAAGTYLLPACLALCLAILAAPALSLPVNLALVLAALLLATLGGLSPTGAAVDALLRGRWLPSEPIFSRALPSLGAALACIIVGMVLRTRSNP